jgi:hypothetical protein
MIKESNTMKGDQRKNVREIELDDLIYYLGHEWDLIEADENIDLTPQRGGKIKDFPPICRGSVRSFAGILVITFCLIFVITIVWGTCTNNWVPLEEARGILMLILAFLSGQHFQKG